MGKNHHKCGVPAPPEAQAAARSSTPGWRDRALFGALRSWLLLRHFWTAQRFRRKIGRWPNPALPRSRQDKYLWRRFFDRNPDFITMCGKLETKTLLAERLPELEQVPTLWCGTAPAELPDSLLSTDVMLKANVGSGTNVLVPAGQMSRAALHRHWRKWHRSTRWRKRLEWGYRGVTQQLFAEPILALGGGDLPTDIKVYVSCGTAVCSWVVDKQNHRSTTYDEMARPLPERGSQHPDEAQGLPPTPETIALVRQAMALAPGAAGDIDQIRVDFLVADGRLLAGELTVYPDGGYDQIANSRSEAIINDHWDLTRSHFMRSPHRGLARLYAEALRRNV